MSILFFCLLCFLGGLCAAPVRMEMRGGIPWRMNFRYLCFRTGISPALRRGFRRLVRRVLKTRDFSDLSAYYGSFFRKPMKMERFSLKAVFSSGDAAETALLYGGLYLAVHALPLGSAGKDRLSGVTPDITLEPRFSAREEFSFDCDISFSLPAAVFLYRFIVIAVKQFHDRRRYV
jgi:hypothetical protein